MVSVDTAIIFISGAMVGQIIMVIFLNVWEWMESKKDNQPQPAHPDTAEYWQFDPASGKYRMKGEVQDHRGRVR